MVNKADLHDKRVQDLVLHPNKLGLENIIISAKEVNLFNGQQQIAQPDLIYISKHGDIYIAEYKCGPQHHKKALSQLRRAEEFIYDNFKLPINKIYTHSDYYFRRI